MIESTLFKELEQSISNTISFSFTITNNVNILTPELCIIMDQALIEIWADIDQFEIVSDSGKMLSQLLKYSYYKMPDRAAVDVVFLLTTELLSDGEGIAKVGAIGTAKKSGAVIHTDLYSAPISAFTLVHELFHLFGVKHDQNDNDYLMAKHTENHACVILSSQSVKELNAHKPKSIIQLQKGVQNWTPIGVYSKEHSSDVQIKSLTIWSYFLHYLMYVGIGLLALVVFLAVAYCLTRKRKEDNVKLNDIELALTSKERNRTLSDA